MDEDFTKWITKWQQPYHVAWVGDRLTITPPLLPVVSRVSEALGLRKSWSFSPGDAERAWSLGLQAFKGDQICGRQCGDRSRHLDKRPRRD